MSHEYAGDEQDRRSAKICENRHGNPVYGSYSVHSTGRPMSTPPLAPYDDGTHKSLHSMQSSQSTFEDSTYKTGSIHSNSASRQSTLTSQTAMQYRHHANQHGTQHSIQIGDDEPYIETQERVTHFIDEDGTETQRIRTINETIRTSRVAVIPGLNGDHIHGQPINGNRHSILTHDQMGGSYHSAATPIVSTLPRQYPTLPRKVADEPLPSPPSSVVNQPHQQSAQHRYVENVKRESVFDEMQNTAGTLRPRSTCWDKSKYCTKKVFCFLNHELTLVGFVLLIQTLFCIVFFGNLLDDWPRWYLVFGLLAVLILTYILALTGYFANKPSLYFPFVASCFLIGAATFLFAIFYLFIHTSNFFESAPIDSGAAIHYNFFHGDAGSIYTSFSQNNKTSLAISLLLGCFAIAEIYVAARLLRNYYKLQKQKQPISPPAKQRYQITNVVGNSTPLHTMPNPPTAQLGTSNSNSFTYESFKRN